LAIYKKKKVFFYNLFLILFYFNFIWQNPIFVIKLPKTSLRVLAKHTLKPKKTFNKNIASQTKP